MTARRQQQQPKQYVSKPFEGFFETIEDVNGNVFSTGWMHIPAMDGTLVLAHLTNRGQASKLNFVVDVEFEPIGTLVFEVLKGFDPKKPAKTKNRCLIGTFVDTDGVEKSQLSVFANTVTNAKAHRKVGDPIYSIHPRTEKLEVAAVRSFF